MFILIIIYFLFLAVYLGFNTYGIIRVISMRIKGDFTGMAVLIYIIAIGAIIFATVSFMMTLDWGTNLNLRFYG